MNSNFFIILSGVHKRVSMIPTKIRHHSILGIKAQTSQINFVKNKINLLGIIYFYSGSRVHAI